VVGLVVLFVVVVLWPPRGKRWVVTVPVSATDTLAIPPIPYSQEDVQRLAELANRGSYVAYRPLHSIDATSRQGLEQLGKRLQTLGLEDDSVLILYVSAQGASRDGKAYLAASDVGRRTGRGWCDMNRLLDSLSQCPGQLKLLILDSGTLVSDPYLGMLVNDFNALLEQQLAQRKVEPLWVLLSHGPFEVSQTLPARQRSLFGWSVEQGLLGAADGEDAGGNGDGVISLPNWRGT